MPIQRFNKILVANRGEIAVRIIKACAELNILSVAVFSSADNNSLHVSLADEAVYIGESEAHHSYLNGERIIEAALSVGAQAIHPGYGFLAENAGFAELCTQRGLAFIGPSAASMRAVASKDSARTLVQSLSIPTIPGIEQLLGSGMTSDAEFISQCESLGFPLLLKAAAGGGGLGMRIVEESGQLEDAFQSVRREAQTAFGDDAIIVEKYLGGARHIEVQLLADSHGHCVHLHERDCSIQRRRQKIVEESPARNLPQETKQALCDAAVSIAKAIDYCGAGTVEFMLGSDRQFYFLEMNTRLQVEHGVTEAVTSVDIVQWQIRIAEGEVLTLNQSDIQQRGHAIECRICAEIPAADFIPASGTVSFWRAPSSQRCDSGIQSGSQISVYYDSLLAKVVSYGSDFSEANRNLQTALADTALLGVDSNLAYLRSIVASKPWREADIDTRAVDRNHTQWSVAVNEDDSDYLICAAVILFENKHLYESSQLQSSWPGQQHCSTHWHASVGDRDYDIESVVQIGSLSAIGRSAIEQSGIGQPGMAAVIAQSSISIGENNYLSQLHTVNPVPGSAGLISATIEISQRRVKVTAKLSEHSVQLHSNSLGTMTVAIGSAKSARGSGVSEDILCSPMPAKIVAISVAVGDEFAEGQELLLIESMKMETRLLAARQGVIQSIHVSEGELVESGKLLLEFELEN